MPLANQDDILTEAGRVYGTHVQNIIENAMACGPVKIKKFSIPIGASTSEIDTGWDLPPKAIVLDVFYNVTALQATVTLDVGVGLGTETGYNHAGFIVNGTVAALGLHRKQAVVTTGSSETYYSSCLRGALLCDFLAGTDAASDFGVYREKPFLTDSITAKSVGYTRSAEYTTATVDVYILYIEI